MYVETFALNRYVKVDRHLGGDTCDYFMKHFEDDGREIFNFSARGESSNLRT